MKNIKAIFLLVLAVVIGLAAAFYASVWLSQSAGGSPNKIVVAAVDIEPGSKLTAQMLNTLDWPTEAVPAGAITDIKVLEERVVKVGLLRGEPVVDRKLAPVGTQGGLSAIIAEGKRAMTVRVNDVVGVAGFALPGTYVDVMVNTQLDKDSRTGENRQISKTVLEHVLVLAVAQEAGRDDSKPKVVSAVTLELSLEDSEKLDLARSVGNLSLVLRNQSDQKAVSTLGVTKNQLFNQPEAALVKVVAPPKPVIAVSKPAPVRAAPQNCIEIVQNGTRTSSCFD